MENKIFVLYLNTDGKSRTVVQQMYDFYIKQFNNVGKLIVIPVDNQDTKLECIYPSMNKNKKEIDNIMIKMYELMINNKNAELVNMIKDIDRKLKISKLNN